MNIILPHNLLITLDYMTSNVSPVVNSSQWSFINELYGNLCV